MARTLTVIGPDNGTDYFNTFVTALNAQFADRSLLDDLDGMDASFDVCVADAASTFSHGEWDAFGEDYYVALDGAPILSILPAH